jgi:NAD/NADP transhydrogenase alpha subunit
VVGYTDLPGRLATTASQLYGTNLLHLLQADMGGNADNHVEPRTTRWCAAPW